MVNYCCNLAACYLEITDWDIDAIPDASITLSSCLFYFTFLSLQGDSTGCSQLFRSIVAPSLQILDYQGYFWIRLGGVRPLESPPEHQLSWNAQGGSSPPHRKYCIKILSPYPLSYSLVFGRSRKRSAYYSYLHSYPNPGYATFMTTLHEIKHQYSHDSAPTILLFFIFFIFGNLWMMLTYGCVPKSVSMRMALITR